MSVDVVNGRAASVRVLRVQARVRMADAGRDGEQPSVVIVVVPCALATEVPLEVPLGRAFGSHWSTRLVIVGGERLALAG